MKTIPFLLLLSSCSFISVHEGPKPEQRKSTWIGITTNHDENIRVRRNTIDMFVDSNKTGECLLFLNGGQTVWAKIDCKELELELQR